MSPTMPNQSVQEAQETTKPSGLPRMTTKQTLLALGVANGETIAEAGRAAGYQSRHNAHDVYREMRERIPLLMDDIGLGEKELLLHLRDQLNASKIEFASYRGSITDAIEVPDNPAKGKALEMALNLRGMSQREMSGPSIGTVNITWHGAAPAWGSGASPDAASAPSPTLDATIESSTVTSVVTDSVTDTMPPPISTVEGTESEGGAPTHTHQVTLTEKCSREKKKRKPRLPVYRGER